MHGHGETAKSVVVYQGSLKKQCCYGENKLLISFAMFRVINYILLARPFTGQQTVIINLCTTFCEPSVFN